MRSTTKFTKNTRRLQHQQSRTCSNTCDSDEHEVGVVRQSGGDIIIVRTIYAAWSGRSRNRCTTTQGSSSAIYARRCGSWRGKRGRTLAGLVPLATTSRSSRRIDRACTKDGGCHGSENAIATKSGGRKYVGNDCESGSICLSYVRPRFPGL